MAPVAGQIGGAGGPAFLRRDIGLRVVLGWVGGRYSLTLLCAFEGVDGHIVGHELRQTREVTVAVAAAHLAARLDAVAHHLT